MPNSVLLRKWNILFALVILFLFGSCDNDDDYSQPSSYLISYAFLESPLANSAVTTLDMDENVIQERPAPATSSSGAFSILLDGLPDQFRIVVSGGNFQDESEPFDGQLMAQFENVTIESSPLYINAVTTLVCSYLDLHPDMTLETAISEIKSFLEIPEDVDIGEGLYLSDEYFSHSEFLEDASSNGDFSLFIQGLIEELDQDPTATHPFRPQSLLQGTNSPVQGLQQCPGTTMGQAARNGLIAWGVGFAMDIGFEEMGLNGILGPEDNDAKILEQLGQMQNMLRDIQSQVTDLGGQIRDAKEEIIAEIDKVAYGVAIGNIVDYETLILNTFKDLKNELDLDPSNMTETQKTARISNLEDYMDTVKDHIFPYRGSLHKKLYGISGTDGALFLYAKTIKNRYRYWTKETQEKVQKMFEYYNMIEALEIELCTEYARSTQKAVSTINDVINQGESNSQAELDWFNQVTPLNPYFLWDSQSDLLLSMYPAGSLWSAFTSSQPVCPDAETDYDAFWTCFDQYIAGTCWEMIYFTNTDDYLIYTDWRLPTMDEWRAFYAGWSPGYQSPASYFDAHVLSNDFDLLGTAGVGIYAQFHTSSGLLYDPSNDQSVNWNEGITIPVRKPVSPEKYFWSSTQ